MGGNEPGGQVEEAGAVRDPGAELLKALMSAEGTSNPGLELDRRI